MAHLLAIRFAALGDVAMTIPVVCSFAKAFPQHRITVLSNRAYAPLFQGLPDNVAFHGADLKGTHRGLRGLRRLCGELKAYGFDGVVDLNSVLRSFVLDAWFRLGGIPVRCVGKAKKAQRALTRRTGKRLRPVPSTFERYADTFRRAGYRFPLEFRSVRIRPDEQAGLTDLFGPKGTDQWIGIAPFAKEAGKIYPLEQMEQVVAALAARPHTRVFLFGGGRHETEVFERWTRQHPSLTPVAGRLDMHREVVLMSLLDAMLTMDSANMHLASLVGTPVVSVWGATHPLSGFMGWRQQTANAVQADLPCRPCSSHGTRPCYKGTLECMHAIHPRHILGRIETLLHKPTK